MALTQVHTHWNTLTHCRKIVFYTATDSHTVKYTLCPLRGADVRTLLIFVLRITEADLNLCVFVLDTSIVRTFGVMRTYCLAPQIEDVLLYVCVCVYIHISQLNVLFVSSLTDFTKTHRHTHTPRLRWTNCWLCVCVSSPDFFIHLNVCECVCC